MSADEFILQQQQCIDVFVFVVVYEDDEEDDDDYDDNELYLHFNFIS